eukprot:GHVL01043874.1.p1 GENE.GHVL01043874.1~~GHVL01043874.1.p1  ORF type:complete len:221 (-),score=49.65 GHVL01043874.1:223-885(-)
MFFKSIPILSRQRNTKKNIISHIQNDIHKNYIYKNTKKNIEKNIKIHIKNSEIYNKNELTIYDIEDRLKHGYVPKVEDLKISQKRNKIHKKIWNIIKRQRFHLWHISTTLFNTYKVPLDEVSYTMLLHGYLMSPKQGSIDKALIVLQEMLKAGVHPSLVRLNEGLLLSYLEMKNADATPRMDNWRSTARTCWAIAIRFKRRRMRLAELQREEVMYMYMYM